VWVALQPVLATVEKPLAREEQAVLERQESEIEGYSKRLKDAYAAMEEEVRTGGISFIDLQGALGDKPELLFADECHFGDEAAGRIAKAIADALPELPSETIP
jgi:hypothetical protein